MTTDQGRVAVAFERYAAELVAFLRVTLRDPELAADVMAESFARLVAQNAAGQFPEQPRPWLYRVALNLAVSHARRRLVEARAMDRIRVASRDDAFPSPEHLVLRVEQLTELDHLLGGVGTVAREALLLSAHGYGGEAIARRIGRSHGATRTLLCRTRAPLRHAVKARRAQEQFAPGSPESGAAA